MVVDAFAPQPAALGRRAEGPGAGAWRGLLWIALLLALPFAVRAEPPRTAPGFEAMAPGSRLLLMPMDVELYTISAGGVASPRADWTATARGHIETALKARAARLGLETVALDEAGAEAFAEAIGLHVAVARSILLHHLGSDNWALPTKQGRLDWSLGDALAPLQARTGARYALFLRVRDSYASGERKAALFGLALLGVIGGGGVQAGYASLVDLQTGRVLWFNALGRGTGDLREEKAAAESVEALLAGFPAAK